jgi:hypothetical protein
MIFFWIPAFAGMTSVGTIYRDIVPREPIKYKDPLWVEADSSLLPGYPWIAGSFPVVCVSTALVDQVADLDLGWPSQPLDIT